MTHNEWQENIDAIDNQIEELRKKRRQLEFEKPEYIDFSPLRSFLAVTGCKETWNKALQMCTEGTNLRIAPSFLQVRAHGEYEGRGFYLGHETNEGDIKWVVVEDELKAQILVPINNVL